MDERYILSLEDFIKQCRDFEGQKIYRKIVVNKTSFDKLMFEESINLNAVSKEIEFINSKTDDQEIIDQFDDKIAVYYIKNASDELEIFSEPVISRFNGRYTKKKYVYKKKLKLKKKKVKKKK